MNSEQIGRLAFREEGENWTAYWAQPGTMEGAIQLGQIKLRFVAERERKDAFIALMRAAMSDMIEEATGIRPVWPDNPQPAPEHERAGRG